MFTPLLQTHKARRLREVHPDANPVVAVSAAALPRPDPRNVLALLSFLSLFSSIIALVEQDRVESLESDMHWPMHCLWPSAVNRIGQRSVSGRVIEITS